MTDDEQRREDDLRTALSGPDPSDVDQARGLNHLATIADSLQAEVRQIERTSTPTFLQRSAIQYMTLLYENLAHTWFVLQPGGRTFPRVGLASPLMRSSIDIYARLVEAHLEGEEALKARMAYSLAEDRVALRIAGEAGSDVVWAHADLDVDGGTTRQRPKGTAAVLEDACEFEMRAIYKWESGVLHVGSAYSAGRTASVGFGAGELEVTLQPPSLWRTAQVTWAALGVARRSTSLAAALAGIDLATFAAAKDAADDVKGIANRSFLASEPPSPHYGAFALSIWEPPAIPLSPQAES